MLGSAMRLQRPYVRLVLIHSIELAAIVASVFLAFSLRFDFAIPASERGHLMFALSSYAILKEICFHLWGLNTRSWRSVCIQDAVILFRVNAAGSLLCAAACVLLIEGFPRSIFVLDFVICLLITTGVRITARLIAEVELRSNRQNGEPTFVYGAGAAGELVCREIRSNRSLPYDVCGFLDDNPSKHGMRVQGIRVLGGENDLERLAARHRVRTVLLAMPSVAGPRIAGILNSCNRAGLKVKTVPSVSEFLNDDGLHVRIRKVDVNDLLERVPVHLEMSQVGARIKDEVVLVTGAAGSIGSELCRQIMRFKPRSLIGLDIAETPLFHVGLEMDQEWSGLTFIPVVANIQNKSKVAETIEQYRPSFIYHAAAYKHVGMMESNIFEAVENNVFGTYNLAAAATKYGVRDFVTISTDKAVHPTSVMGLSKRIAELIVRSMQDQTTRFVSVRFGNVLGSFGSVVPIFKEQIAHGGPVTVTHPEIRRFFMMIPEAAQLVLQASIMGNGGETFVLKMGEPVRIVDLARNLILLSGLRPDEDIQIIFTGIRPGEKLYEEISLTNENVVPTKHEKIMVFLGEGFEPSELRLHLENLAEFCRVRNLAELIQYVRKLVPDYNPSTVVLHKIAATSASRRDVMDAGVASVAAS